ncbi:antitoxin [Oceaniferula spumae]|uniref:Antitoxin n=1 Tax=Oceaniferula spumae TaxID=2979115 RepID=A0AAT9FJE9_9BACT
MTTLSYTNARNNLASVMKQATDDREPITITRNGHESVVVLSMEEYESMEETLHLLSSPANAERLRQGLEDFEKGNFSTHQLAE